jgi:hypothetical protein
VVRGRARVDFLEFCPNPKKQQNPNRILAFFAHLSQRERAPLYSPPAATYSPATMSAARRAASSAYAPSSGNADVPPSSERGFGAPSRSFDASQNTALLSNVLAHGPTLTARQYDIYAGPTGSQHVLPGPEMTAAAPSPSSPSPLPSSFFPSHNEDPSASPYNARVSKQRQLRRHEQVESGVGALLSSSPSSSSSSPAPLPPRTADDARARVRSLIPQVDCGAVTVSAFKQALERQLHVSPSSVPQLDRLLFPAPSHGRIDADGILAAIDTAILAATNNNGARTDPSPRASTASSSPGAAARSAARAAASLDRVALLMTTAPPQPSASSAAASSTSSPLSRPLRPSPAFAASADLPSFTEGHTSGSSYYSPHVPPSLRHHGDIIANPPPERTPRASERAKPVAADPNTSPAYAAWYGESPAGRHLDLLSVQQRRALDRAPGGTHGFQHTSHTPEEQRQAVRDERLVVASTGKIKPHPSRLGWQPPPFAVG